MNLQDLEIWGGVECTVNRVGDNYFDQIEKSGHAQRLSDLDHFHDLGFRTLRIPVLWERFVKEGGNWSWFDSYLNRLRELDIKPVAGLSHHGSGPPDTNLLDPLFPVKLAGFAKQVASR